MCHIVPALLYSKRSDFNLLFDTSGSNLPNRERGCHLRATTRQPNKAGMFIKWVSTYWTFFVFWRASSVYWFFKNTAPRLLCRRHLPQTRMITSPFVLSGHTLQAATPTSESTANNASENNQSTYHFIVPPITLHHAHIEPLIQHKNAI